MTTLRDGIARRHCEMTGRNDMPDHDRPESSRGRAERFRMLRRDTARLEGRAGTARLPLGVEPLDSALAGGLALGRVHLLSGRPGHDGALTGFTVALLRRLLARQDSRRSMRPRRSSGARPPRAAVPGCFMPPGWRRWGLIRGVF